MYENDYLMKMIKTTLQAVASLLKGKKFKESNAEKNSNIVITKDEILQLMITKYINEGEINKAENIIFEAIESSKSSKYLELALFFYEEISKWDESKLRSCNFSREELLQGLDEVKKIYNKR